MTNTEAMGGGFSKRLILIEVYIVTKIVACVSV